MSEAAADQAVVEVLLEFIEAVIHQVLFVRELYSGELFERRRLYGVAVRRARHPELCDYVHEVVASLKDVLARGTLAKLGLVVQSPGGEAVERFVIEPAVLCGPAAGGAAAGAAGGATSAGALDLAEVEGHLRGFVLKLQYIDSYLRRPPPGCTFELVAYTAGRSGLASGDWVEEQAGAEGGGSGGATRGPQLELSPAGGTASAEVVPIKSCRMEGAFRLQLYAEGVPPE